MYQYLHSFLKRCQRGRSSCQSIFAWFVLLVVMVFIPFVSFAQEKETMGWVEKISIAPEGFLIHAKLDTGADYSSLSAQGMKKFKKDGKDWVRFQVKNRYGKISKLEREIVRTARIKRHEGGAHERYVVQVGICLGHKYMEEEFNLANRENFNYQALIGRNFLAGNTVVDPAVTYTATPACIKNEVKDIH